MGLLRERRMLAKRKSECVEQFKERLLKWKEEADQEKANGTYKSSGNGGEAIINRFNEIHYKRMFPQAEAEHRNAVIR